MSTYGFRVNRIENGEENTIYSGWEYDDAKNELEDELERIEEELSQDGVQVKVECAGREAFVYDDDTEMEEPLVKLEIVEFQMT